MESSVATDAPTSHAKLKAWVDEIAALTQPDAIHWCDGSPRSTTGCAQALVDARHVPAPDEAKRPNCYLALVRPG